MLPSFSISARSQPGYLQHHVFLAGAVFTDGAGILAAVSGIEHDNDRPIAPGFTRFRPALRRRNLPLQIAFIVILEQRQQRILHVGRVGRVEIHDQTLFKTGDRSEREQLRFYVLFQLEHHAYGLRVELSHAGGLNIGIVAANLVTHAF